jgi:ABC-type amino acid transport substrate-binding protein
MRAIRRRQWRVAALLALLALVVTGCGGGEGGGATETTGTTEARKFPAGTTMARLQQKGEITIGVKFDVPPFGFKNPQTGDVEGFDVDLGKAVAAALGVRPKFIEAVSDNRIPFLRDGTADLILSTMTITRERSQEIDFSEPYYIAHGRILVPKDSTITDVAGLAGKRVCTALGSTYADTLKEKAPRATLRLVDSYSECLELIQNKAVDAVSTDDVILAGMIIQDRDLKLVGPELTTEPYGAGLKKGDARFQAFLDEVVAKYKSDGSWERAYQKWVGRYTGQKQEPPTLTLQQALKEAPK